MLRTRCLKTWEINVPNTCTWWAQNTHGGEYISHHITATHTSYRRLKFLEKQIMLRSNTMRITATIYSKNPIICLLWQKYPRQFSDLTPQCVVLYCERRQAAQLTCINLLQLAQHYGDMLLTVTQIIFFRYVFWSMPCLLVKKLKISSSSLPHYVSRLITALLRLQIIPICIFPKNTSLHYRTYLSCEIRNRESSVHFINLNKQYAFMVAT